MLQALRCKDVSYDIDTYRTSFGKTIMASIRSDANGILISEYLNIILNNLFEKRIVDGCLVKRK